MCQYVENESVRNTPSISVIMTVYNHEKYLRQAIEGVLNQVTDFPFEILINDDASTDGSASIIREYEQAHPEIIIGIYQKKNLYSRGVDFWSSIFSPRARGKYLAYCEGDDFWIRDDRLQKTVDYLEAHPECSAVYQNCVIVDEEGVPSKALAQKKAFYARRPEQDVSLDDFLLEGIFPGQYAAHVMRSFLLRDMDVPMYEDYVSIKANDDVKHVVLSMCSGTVHVQSDVAVAHRVVFSGGDSWSARTAGSNLSGLSFAGGWDIRAFCKGHFGIRYRNEWGLFRDAVSALKRANRDPSAENARQMRYVTDRLSDKLALKLLSLAVRGLPRAVRGKIRRLRTNYPLSSGL